MKDCPGCKGSGVVGCMEICPDCGGSGEVSFTQGDRIRSMTDEQLVSLLRNAWRAGVHCSHEEMPCATCCCEWNIDLKRCSDDMTIALWLQKEV